MQWAPACSEAHSRIFHAQGMCSELLHAQGICSRILQARGLYSRLLHAWGLCSDLLHAQGLHSGLLLAQRVCSELLVEKHLVNMHSHAFQPWGPWALCCGHHPLVPYSIPLGGCFSDTGICTQAALCSCTNKRHFKSIYHVNIHRYFFFERN